MRMPLRTYINDPVARRLWGLSLVCLSLWLGGAGCNNREDTPENDVIARYNDQYLYRGELDAFIPANMAGADSARFAQNYIQTWLQNQAVEERARTALPDLDARIQHRLNAVRAKLIEQEYNQYIVNRELYKTISLEEMKDYFGQYPEKFSSKTQYFSYFYVALPDSPSTRQLGLLNSKDESRIEEFRRWCEEQDTLDYKLDSSFQTVMTLENLSEGFPFDIKRASLNQVYSYQNKDPQTGNTRYVLFKMLGTIKEGELKPFSMCKEDIEAIILNNRRKRIIEANESSLLDQARKNNKITEFYP